MRKFLSTENIIRGLIVVGLVAFASTKYEFANVLLGLLIILGMTVLGTSILRLYQGFKVYLRERVWGLSPIRTIMLVLLAVGISVSFLVLLTPELKLYAFLVVGIILSVLLIYDLIRKLI